MGFLFSVTFTTIFVSALSGQHFLAEARIDGYTQWKGMFQPIVSDWNDQDPWLNGEDPYLSDNGIDNSGHNEKEYNDDPDIRYFIIETKGKPQQAQPTLMDLLRFNNLDEILGGTARIPDNSDFAQPLNVLNPPINDISKPSSTQNNNNNVNLIPSAMISSRPFRMGTLASMGYGPNFRFYR